MKRTWHFEAPLIIWQSTCVSWLLYNYDANINVAVSMAFSFRRGEPTKDALVERERREEQLFSKS
jgi:hypothetical protein